MSFLCSITYYFHFFFFALSVTVFNDISNLILIGVQGHLGQSEKFFENDFENDVSMLFYYLESTFSTFFLQCLVSIIQVLEFILFNVSKGSLFLPEP